MASQATLERTANGRQPNELKTARRSMTRNLGHVAHDLMTLGELQLELLKSDVRESMHRIVPASVMMIAGAVLAVGTVPVILISLGHAIALWSGLTLAASFAISAVLGLIVAAVVAYAGYRSISRALTTFERSKRELIRNVQWLKETLKRQPDQPNY